MIKAENQFEMNFPAKPENESFARHCVSAFICTFDPTVSELADLKTALSEAVTNSVIHAYRGREAGQVYISVKMYKDRKLVIRVKDRGCGMEDLELCKTPLYTTDPEGERGGMGIPIMENFTDRLHIKTAVGKGTTVTMMKKLS